MEQLPLVLLADDEPDLVATLEYAFQREAFAVRTARTGMGALDAASAAPRPDLILLDLMLPDIGGTEVFRKIRANPITSHIPVIIVTAKSDEVDRIVGLELGADDYVTKPFNTRELILRARAVLRRSHRPVTHNGTSQSVSATHAVGCLRVDVNAHRVWVDEQEVTLTRTELLFLCALLEHRGEVLSRDDLLQTCSRGGDAVTVRAVDTHVKRLRKKLGKAAVYIQTSRGFGYRLDYAGPRRPITST